MLQACDEEGPSQRAWKNCTEVFVEDGPLWKSELSAGSPLRWPEGDVDLFDVDLELNDKVFVHQGDICNVPVDVIVAFSDVESIYGSQRGLCGRLIMLGSESVVEALRDHESSAVCRSGEARVIRAFHQYGTALGGEDLHLDNHLAAKYIAFTVGPRFNLKYQIAAHNTLNSCCREVLKSSTDKLQTPISLSLSFPEIPAFPQIEALHTFFRTLRRWIDMLRDKVREVHFVASSIQNFDLLLSFLSVYFPRNHKEHKNVKLNLTVKNFGNIYGELQVQARQIRLAPSLVNRDVESDQDDKEKDVVQKVRKISDIDEDKPKLLQRNSDIHPDIDISFTTAAEHDQTISYQRLSCTEKNKSTSLTSGPSSWKDVPAKDLTISHLGEAASELFSQVLGTNEEVSKTNHNIEYLKLLRESEGNAEVTNRLKQITPYKFIYKAGLDNADRTIIVFAAAFFPAALFSSHDLLLYIVRVLDPYIKDKYVLLYINNEVCFSSNHPGLDLLRKIWELYSYQQTLQEIWVLYPDLLFKTTFACCWPILPSLIWNATKYLDSLSDLGAHCNLDEVEIPRYVLDYEKSGKAKKKNEFGRWLGIS